jgi:hypothetical protein
MTSRDLIGKIIPFGREQICTELAYTVLATLALLYDPCGMLLAMLRRVHLSDTDLELAEQSCRSLAHTYRNDAKRQTNPIVADGMLEHAERFERLAERLRRGSRLQSVRFLTLQSAGLRAGVLVVADCIAADGKRRRSSPTAIQVRCIRRAALSGVGE